MMKKEMSKRIRIGLIALAILAVAAAIVFYGYTLDYYRASDDVETWIQENQERIEVRNNLTIVYPEPVKDLEIGLIFYPGGKVEAKAYLPLLIQLADEGLTCGMPMMPFNLAVFNSAAADAVYDELPEIDHWILSGHSLGGAMASRYAGTAASKVDGLILMGAYPINEADLPTYALYGTYDIKLDLEKLEATETYEILGGNHAYFGNYGDQEGDGEAVISREKQQRIAVREIMSFIARVEAENN